ncbi:MAG: S-adenosylmethionine:tRNA ribosyltransferase-isomerase [Oligoflexia bacterium]|nr:MAG: S-adenosylmethionine:tRNA ribosyltransferase-isomerase [Oligoflexia bacterium]
MKTSDLDYSFPEELIATEPARPSRVLWVQDGQPAEITLDEVISRIPAGDVLVVNDTQVLKRRVFAGDLEILFLKNLGQNRWEVLFPSRKYAVGSVIDLPLGVQMTLVQKGRPQVVQVSENLTEDYFSQVGELPLPPYIQKARDQRHTVKTDETWYQTAWAQKPGSFAAPTASLHFSAGQIQSLKKRGVHICEITLHVGLGTFLPVTVEDLDLHEMHEEYVEISPETVATVNGVLQRGGHVWAMGTTVTRALESMGSGVLAPDDQGGYRGWTRILIQPGYEWKIVSRLLTNFHQPQSTLLALVAGFSGLKLVKQVYQYAIEKRFRLFSYGDLSVWIRSE